MSLSITITDSIDSITRNVNVAIADYINKLIRSKENVLISSAKRLVDEWVSNQPEILSLKSSSPASLVGVFGIPGNTDNIVNTIVSSVVNSISIKFVPYSKNLKGGLELNFQPSNFANLLSLPEGHTRIENGDLHWLDWLLKRGDNIIIVNYQYNPTSGLGRSGLGNMVAGGSFRVPPQFSGTEDNNFITRALIGPNQEKQITKLFSDILG
jgi:hypothetical protein